MEFEPEISVFRPDRLGIRKVLGDLEAEIMELIWARPPSQGTTVRDVFRNPLPAAAPRLYDRHEHDESPGEEAVPAHREA